MIVGFYIQVSLSALFEAGITVSGFSFSNGLPQNLSTWGLSLFGSLVRMSTLIGCEARIIYSAAAPVGMDNIKLDGWDSVGDSRRRGQAETAVIPP